MQENRGFSLIELMIVVAVIAMLSAVAYPSYTDYVRRGKLTEAISALSDMRVKMEQFFQDNRTYVGACTAGTQAPLPAATSNFTFACTPAPTASAYTVKATGINAMAGFTYSVDQSNTRRTLALPTGWNGTGNSCWVLKKDGSC
jgi:type IV pilus assembly protein PilE